MRSILYGVWLVGGAATLSSSVTGCTADCGAKGSCGEYLAPQAGASGEVTAGESGSSDASNAGLGGGSGRGGDASDDAGSSGLAGEGGAAGAGGLAGEGGAAGAGGEVCDTSKSPTEEACLVSNDYAVFVAPNGKNNAPGTMAAPLATLSQAIAIAGATKFVVVCDAVYDEHVTISSRAQVYGGFSCGNGNHWVAESGAPIFKPSDAGPALKIDTVAEDVVLEALGFEAPSATVPGGTSVAAVVNASPKVQLSHVSLTAGSGMAGENGSLTPFVYQAQTALDGNAETATGMGGAEKSCACQTGLVSVGGAGGPPASSGQNGSDGLPDLDGGQAGDHTKACSAGGGGGDGSDAPGAGAAVGAMTLGVLSAEGWQPASGKDGSPGAPGQGGGGGASRNNLAHGGGGGCGGCGGNGGTSGKGGGASIALLLVDSSVALNACNLKTTDAGDGGAGVAGQPAQQQLGNGGNSLASTNSCGGGSGGKGGDGGASGGGAGGVSVALLWKGKFAPKLTASTTTTGRAGTKGIGGVPGTNDGIAGVTQDVLYAP